MLSGHTLSLSSLMLPLPNIYPMPVSMPRALVKDCHYSILRIFTDSTNAVGTTGADVYPAVSFSWTAAAARHQCPRLVCRTAVWTAVDPEGTFYPS